MFKKEICELSPLPTSAIYASSRMSGQTNYENCWNRLSAIQCQVKFNTTDRWSYGHQLEKKNTIRKSKIYFLQNAPEEISTMSGHMTSGFNELTVWCPYSSNMSIDPHFHPFYQQSSQAISRVQRLPYSSTSIFRHGELIQATSHKGTSQFNSSPLVKMAPILQTTFSNAFSWMKSFVFRSKFHWSLSLNV